MRDYPVASANGHLAANDIWSIPPAPTNEVRGNLKTIGPWQIPTSYRALAMDMHGRVFGLRTMSNPRASGYALEGRVKVEGHSYRAFTSSKLFERQDGSLCEVAIVYVCGTPDLQWPDPEAQTERDRMTYVKDLHARYFYQKDGTYAQLKEYARCLELVWNGTNAEYPWCAYDKRAAELRAELAPKMGWR